ncbi:hypothetical protein K5Q02_22575 [Pseudomonas sp. MM211]|uniref:hypothetical protein n=1 Tax=Pseudomonas sp. MM211 TaxID=2866808 RepID=UPI001CED1E5F|nr:hypothetical protein [Pseudomonas sp. MM211]UCJ16526.1 hypothetical protein K5Q02_22575 [Pseudomonas sp. MM211]
MLRWLVQSEPCLADVREVHFFAVPQGGSIASGNTLIGFQKVLPHAALHPVSASESARSRLARYDSGRLQTLKIYPAFLA